jgi:hypothetical protein
LVPGGLVPDQSDKATRGRVVADLMGLGFDMIRSGSESTAGRSACRLGGLAERFDQERVNTAEVVSKADTAIHRKALPARGASSWDQALGGSPRENREIRYYGLRTTAAPFGRHIPLGRPRLRKGRFG